MDPVELGRRLAERHARSAAAPDRPEYDPSASLLNYAEVPYPGDWTLRSALVRLAQPEPGRVGAVLELVRRLDAPLHHVRRNLERHIVVCDRSVRISGDRPVIDVAPNPAAPYADVRTADLARLSAAGVDPASVEPAGVDPDGLLDGYQQQAVLDQEEVLTVPLLALAARFEALAESLAGWAQAGPSEPPVGHVDLTLTMVRAELDRLGVPEETDFRPRRG
jgi:hypothetical protein